MDCLDEMDSSIATEFDQPPVPSPASAGTAASSVSTTRNEVVLVTGGTSSIQDALQHPVTTATMDQFGGEGFTIDGIRYLLKDIKVDHLRKFCVKNGVKSTLPPHKSVRTATKKVVVEEIKAKKGRLLNNEADPWQNRNEKKDKPKPTWVNRYRLANVVF